MIIDSTCLLSSNLMYRPENVCFLKREVDTNPSTVLDTNTPKKGRLSLFSISSVNFILLY